VTHDGVGVIRSPAEHAVTIDLDARIILEDEVTERPADADRGCGQHGVEETHRIGFR
jgi:hypothetical protein